MPNQITLDRNRSCGSCQSHTVCVLRARIYDILNLFDFLTDGDTAEVVIALAHICSVYTKRERECQA